MIRAGLAYACGASVVIAAWIGAELLIDGSNIIIPIFLIPPTLLVILIELYETKKEAKKQG